MRSITLFLSTLISFTVYARESKVSQVHPRPLLFVENKGQITDQNGKARKDIDVKLETPGMNIFIGEGAIHYQWYKASGSGQLQKAASDQISNFQFPIPNSTIFNSQSPIETYRMDVELVGANKNAIAVFEEQNSYYENYFLLQFPQEY